MADRPQKTPQSSDTPTGMSLDQLSQAFAAMLGEAGDSTAPLVVAGDPVFASDREPRTSKHPSEPPSAPAVEPADEESFPVNPRTILEAMLFVGRSDNAPLTSEQIAGLMRGVTPAEIDTLVAELNTQYAVHGCAYTIVSQGAGYRTALRPEFGALRERMLGRARAARLSPAAVEVLAVIAYNEPLSATEVNKIRGTSSGHILRHLVRRRLLRLQKPEGKSGHSKYFTTPRFLEVFHLNNLSDLPRSDDLARH